MNSVNVLVHELIENEFQVLPKEASLDKKAADGGSLQNIEHALKVLKILWFIHRNASLLTEQGINFLLHKSVVD